MQIKVNLLPIEQFEKKPLGKFLNWIYSYGRYIIISVELIVLVVFFSRFIFDRKLSDLNDSIEQKKAIVASAADLEKKINDFQNDLFRIKSLEKNRDNYLKIIEQVKKITPKDTYYTNVDFNQEKVELEGKTSSSTSFAYFLSLLKKEGDLMQIDLSKVIKDNDTRMIDFHLTAVIKSIYEEQQKLKKEQELKTASQTTENGAN